ncbi:MAG: 5-oxoprolinase subunit B family protein, partial [Acidimicrobiales bacterium]
AGECSGRTHELPVVYDGPDLDDVGRLTGLTIGEIRDLHAKSIYVVAFLGFSRGFPYLAGLDPALKVPRLDTPRLRVPPGSVGIIGEQCGIYQVSTPGGWRLIGRTEAELFDPLRIPPSRLLPGDRVRFVASSR